MASSNGVSENLSYDRPNSARMYDYLIGGYNNFEIDRMAAKKAIQINPDAPLVMRANRAFLRRAVGFLVSQGITQFLDVGSGIPTAGNVHEVAQKVNPAARVVYVDAEPVAVHHSRTMLEGNPNAKIIQADARQPERILDHPEVRRLLDLEKPTAVLLFCLLHFVPDDEEAVRAVRVLRDALVQGSYVGLSHATYEGSPPEDTEQINKLYSQTATPLRMRSYDQIEGFFEGLELVEPGLVYVPLWRPDDPGNQFLDQPARSVTYSGIGRKP